MSQIETLTPRELEVLSHVARGRTDKGVGLDLHLSEHTIRDYLKRVFRKLGVTSRTAAVSLALREGLIEAANDSAAGSVAVKAPANDAAAPVPHLDIGIDPGVTTGFAIWNCADKRLAVVTSMRIHEALARVAGLAETGAVRMVRFEDARKRATWFGKMDEKQRKYGSAVREGVGSVKRDCTIWEDFLTEARIPFEAAKPAAGSTKWHAAYFSRVTGWTLQTNEHSRDAAILVFGR